MKTLARLGVVAALVLVGDSVDDAHERRARLDGLVNTDSAMAALSIALGHDASTFDPDQPLPDVLDDTSAILPDLIHADLVLDYLRHPDLSEDLAALCERQSIPVIAPGRAIRYAVTPPT
mgnify:CR=1 FL=1